MLHIIYSHHILILLILFNTQITAQPPLKNDTVIYMTQNKYKEFRIAVCLSSVLSIVGDNS